MPAALKGNTQPTNNEAKKKRTQQNDCALIYFETKDPSDLISNRRKKI